MDGIRGPVPGRIPTGGFDPPLRNGGLSCGTAILVHLLIHPGSTIHSTPLNSIHLFLSKFLIFAFQWVHN